MKKFLSALTAFCMGASMIASVMPASALTPLFTDKNKAQADGFTWSITEEVIPESDGYAEIDVFVENDPGTGAYAFQMLINGKEFSEYGIEIEDISKGSAYSAMDTFVPNKSIGYVGASSTSSKDPQFAKANTPVATFGIVVPNTMADGKYELSFSDTEFKVGDADGKELKPAKVAGYLYVGDPNSATEEKPNTPSVSGYTWYIEEGVKPASDGYAEIDVYVANDPGTDSYAFQMLINGKEFSEYGIKIEEIAKGSAYSEMDTFVANVNNGYVGVSTTTAKTAQVAKENVAAVTYGIVVPSTMAAGTYELSFTDFQAGDASGKGLKPTLKAGSLVVNGSSDPVEPPSADEFQWYITKEVVPESDGYAEIDVFVANDPGTGAYAFQMLINGKEFSEYDIEIEDISKGTAYSQMDTFVPNKAIGYVGASSTSTKDPQYAKENTAVATFGIVVPADMPEGKYELTFAPTEFKVGDANGKELKPTLVAGYLVIGDAGAPDVSDPPADVDGFKWYITEEVYPESDGYAEIDVFVANDPGTGAYAFQMLINGKEFSEYDIEIEDISKGTAYSQMDTFVPNKAIGYVGASSTSTKDPQYAKENTAVATFGIVVPEDMPEGRYELTFAPTEFKVGDANGKELKPTLVAGYLIIGETEPKPTEPAPTEPKPTEPAPTEPKPTEPTPTEPTPTEPKPTDPGAENISAEWIIGQVEAEAGETVKVPVTVKGDKDGINSFILDMTADNALKAGKAAAGNAYEALNFVSNDDKLVYAGTNYSLKQNVVAADNAVVFTVEFTVPANAQPGTVYDLEFESLELYNIDMVKLIPTTTDGWIKVKASTSSDESKEIDAEWIIGKVEVNAGEKAVVPVTVKGDVDGINSYILDMGQDAGPVYKNAAAGDAYEGLDFIANEKNLIFAGTNSSLNKNIVAADGAVVFNVEFDVPADAAPGTVYNLKFEDLELYNIDMIKLIPTTTDGWIKIKDSEPTEPTPTEPTPTEPTPTEPTPTEPVPGNPGEWIIGTAEVEAGATVTIPVTVKGDTNGINSYILDMLAKEVDGAAPTASEAAAGDAYAGLGFVFNTDKLTFAGTNYTLGENVMLSADGAVVFEVTFTVPADAAPGTVYDLTFESLSVYDIDMNELAPEQTPGWIKIKDSEPTEPTPTEPTPTEPTPTEPTPTEPTPTEPTPTEPTPTEPTPTEPTPTEPVPGNPGEWIIGTAEVEAGATVTIPVTVKGDTNGINSYILDMLAKEVDGAAPTASEAAAGDAYAGLGFVFNTDKLTFAGTNYTLGENVMLSADGAVVFEVTFTVPADAAPGTVYDLTFESLSVYDIDMNELAPEQTPGWIKIKDSEPTEPTPTEPTPTEPTPTEPTPTEPTPTEPTPTEPTPTEPTPTEPTPTEPTPTEPTPTEPTPTEPTPTEPTPTEPTPTEPTPTEPQPGSATWKIEDVEGFAGKTVAVEVTVSGDTGLNSYEFAIVPDEGPTAVDAVAGDAYAGLAFQKDASNLKYGATSVDVADVKAADGSVVLTVTFQIPADAKPGTVYKLAFADDVLAYDANMVELDITEIDGSITVIKSEIIGYEYDITPSYQFYFSHDPREFKAEDLVETIRRRELYGEGVEPGEWEDVEVTDVDFNGLSPMDVYEDQDSAYVVIEVPATMNDAFNTPVVVGKAYIAVKGDVTLTGEANARDAAAILVYAAAVGSGKTAYIYSDSDEMMEMFAYFLGDVTGESEDNGATDSLGNAKSDLNSRDAAAILVYAAEQGSGKTPDWAKILNKPLPKYTAEIAEAQ